MFSGLEIFHLFYNFSEIEMRDILESYLIGGFMASLY